MDKQMMGWMDRWLRNLFIKQPLTGGMNAWMNGWANEWNYEWVKFEWIGKSMDE